MARFFFQVEPHEKQESNKARNQGISAKPSPRWNHDQIEIEEDKSSDLQQIDRDFFKKKMK